MSRTFEAVKIAEDVYWVGAIDWDVKDFHGYLTSRGTTYNAFLVLDEKVTLIDTVKEPFFDEMIARIASVVELERVDYIVSNHSEMDHSGCLPQTIAALKPEEIFASKMGVKALGNHFHSLGREITVVGDGDSLDLGEMKLSFVMTPMCHWPDSMVSYLNERRLLFSQDVFGMHLACSERFADQLDRSILDYEAEKYYANILLPLSGIVAKALEKIDKLGLELAMIAPDHGPIWREAEDIERIIGGYARWARQKPANKAVVVYDTMWGSTAKMAQEIGDGLTAAGTDVKLMSMGSSHRSDVATEVLGAGALVVGSPTINNSIFPSIADVMCYLKGLQPKNLIGAAFGSHGWGGDASKQLQEMLVDMSVEMVGGPLRVVYVPDDAALRQCRQFGQRIAERLRETCND